MSVSKIAVTVGILLAIQGAGFYVGSASRSVTALIPFLVGLPIAVLGVVARKESARKHAMHAAAALAAVGLLAALGRMAMAGLSFGPAGVSLVLMVVLTGGFLAVCVKSFVDARRRQRQ